MRKLLLKNFQSVGDLVMLTATVRDLHAAAPGQFLTDIRTPFPDLWLNNPHITPMLDADPEIEVIGKGDPEGEGMHYPLIHQSNQRPVHFLQGFHDYLSEKLGIKIPVTKAMGDIHLSDQEKHERPVEVPENYWIMLAGGKPDCKTKHWPTKNFQQVVDAFQGEIKFVQCGDKGHVHPPLRGVINLVGRTTLREFIRLIYWSQGVICPITCALHLSAALPMPSGKIRPCIVIAGGREPPSWTQYNGQQNLNVIGALDCCATGGCWNARVEPENGQIGSMCKRPVSVGGVKYAECMTMITPEDVIRIVKKYQGVQTPQVVIEPPIPERVMQLPPEESALRAAMQRARASGKYCVAIWHENAAGKVDFFKVNNGLAEEKIQEAEVRMVRS